MRLRVVIDTNVIVSAFLSQHSTSAQVLAYFKQEKFMLLVSEPILAEYERALNYPRLSTLHNLNPLQISEEMDELRAATVLVEPKQSYAVVKADPDDDKFFECAVAGSAAYIVSGDQRVQQISTFHGISVVSPRKFLEILKQEG